MPRKSPVPVASAEDTQWTGQLLFAYRIDQQPSSVDILVLSRTLSALGAVILESDRALETSGDRLVISVQPFREGSWIMDVLLQLQRDAGVLFSISQADGFKDLKSIVETVGLIKSAGKQVVSLLDVVRRFGAEKPVKVRRRGKSYEYQAKDGSSMYVSAPVNTLYNNSVITNNFYAAVAAPLENAGVNKIETYLPDDKKNTLSTISRTDAAALQAYSTHAEEELKEEVLESTVIRVLRPKSGNYGEHLGLWTFTLAGTKRTLKAKISDEKFLRGYTRGDVRFYQGDTLKVRLKETQYVSGENITVENEVLEVLKYTPARPGLSTTPNQPGRANRKRRPMA